MKKIALLFRTGFKIMRDMEKNYKILLLILVALYLLGCKGSYIDKDKSFDSQSMDATNYNNTAVKRDTIRIIKDSIR